MMERWQCIGTAVFVAARKVFGRATKALWELGEALAVEEARLLPERFKAAMAQDACARAAIFRPLMYQCLLLLQMH